MFDWMSPRRLASLLSGVFAATFLASVGGCRIGGPSYDGSLPNDSVDASASDAAEDSGHSSSSPDSGSSPGDANANGDGPISPGDGAANEAGGDDGGCAPPGPVDVCDPVCNTGCAFLSRCDLADKPNAGACIGIWIQAEGSSCTKTPTTDPCAVQLSCVDGTCARLCYHDRDCTTAGTCCKKSIDLGGQPSGFRACAPCGP